jgi:RNase P subunit RPR2
MSDLSGDQAPVTKTIEYKIMTKCSRCGYRDSIYNKHEFTVGEPQNRNVMWVCMRCDKQQMFKYTVGKKSGA